MASSTTPSDWSGVSPDHIIAWLKLIKQDVCDQYGLQPIYKSYTQRDKMMMDQHDKRLAWFCKLLDNLKGEVIFQCMLYLYCNTTANYFTFLHTAVTLQTARVEKEKAVDDAASSNNQMTKDDIAHLIHLFKFPGA